MVDHDSGVLLWAHPGRDQKTLEKFFDRLGEQRCEAITLVSADAAEWIANVVVDRCKNAELCQDPFHIVAWATKTLDEVRREVWNAARKQGQHALARDLKGARYALWKNPGDLTARQEAKLASIAQTNKVPYRAYLLKEQLRQVFALKGPEGITLLDAWLKWARRCRIPSFETGQGHHRPPRRRRGGPGPRSVQCPGGEREHQAAPADPHRLRVPLARSPCGAVAMLDLGGLCPPLRAEPDPRPDPQPAISRPLGVATSPTTTPAA